MKIKYSVLETDFGVATVATTEKGICCISFTSDAVSELTQRFKSAELSNEAEPLHHTVVQLLNDWPASAEKAAGLPLDLMGTGFQLSVWNALLSLKPGELSTYKAIAAKAGRPTAVRATGTAIGQNPVAILVPCHRVISSSGKMGGYRWGLSLKKKLLMING